MPEGTKLVESPSQLSDTKMLPPELVALEWKLGREVFSQIREKYDASGEQVRRLLVSQIASRTDEIDALLDAGDIGGIVQLAKGIMEDLSSAISLNNNIPDSAGMADASKKWRIAAVWKGNPEIDKYLSKDSRDIARVMENMKGLQNHIAKIYGLFDGGKEGFEKKFADRMGDWRQAAEAAVDKEAKKKGENLAPEDRAARVEASILLSNQDIIREGVDASKRSEFQQALEDLRKNAKAAGIPYEGVIRRVAPESSPLQQDQIKETLLIRGNDRITRVGDELYSGDQVIDMYSRPPKKYIESNSIRIETTAPYKNPYETIVKIDTLETERSALEADVRGGIARFNDIGKKFRLPEISAKNPDDFLSQARSMREGLLSHFRDQFKQGELSNQSDQDAAKNLLEIVMGEEMIREVADKMRRIDQIVREIEQLRRDEERRVPEYQESVRQHDEVARGNLSYISSLRFDLIGQEWLEYVLERINEERALKKYPLISLENGFSVDDQEDLARMLEQLTGKEPPIFMQNEVPPRIRPDVSVSERLRAAWVLDGMNQFRRERAKAVLEKATQ